MAVITCMWLKDRIIKKTIMMKLCLSCNHGKNSSAVFLLLSAVDISKITASEMKFLRRISGKTKRDLIRNQKIREDLQQPRIEKRLAQRQLWWFGHLSRMDEESKPRQFFEARPDGRRPRKDPGLHTRNA